MELSGDYQSLAPVIRTLEGQFDAVGERIYKARNEIRIVNTTQGRIVAKRFGKIYLANRFIYTWFRQSKAKRSYLNGRALLRLGVDTPPPVGYTEQFSGGILHDSMYLYVFYAGEDNMRRVLKEPDYPDRENLLDCFARYAYTLVEKGVFHKDFSPGNILFEKAGAGYRFTLVDINRIRFGPVSREKRQEVFRRLFSDEATLAILARSFARASGEPEAEMTERMIGYSRRFIRKKTRKKRIKKWLGL